MEQAVELFARLVLGVHHESEIDLAGDGGGRQHGFRYDVDCLNVFLGYAA